MEKRLKQAVPGLSQTLLLPRVLEQADDSDLGLALLIFTSRGRTYSEKLAIVSLLGW